MPGNPDSTMDWNNDDGDEEENTPVFNYEVFLKECASRAQTTNAVLKTLDGSTDSLLAMRARIARDRKSFEEWSSSFLRRSRAMKVDTLHLFFTKWQFRRN